MVKCRRDISECSPVKGCNMIKSLADTEAPPWQKSATNNPKPFRLFLMQYGTHKRPGSWGALLLLQTQWWLVRICWIGWLPVRYIHNFSLFHNRFFPKVRLPLPWKFSCGRPCFVSLESLRHHAITGGHFRFPDGAVPHQKNSFHICRCKVHNPGLWSRTFFVSSVTLAPLFSFSEY